MPGWNTSAERHWTVAYALAGIIMGKERAEADPLAYSEAASLLHDYKSNPYFIKKWFGDYNHPNLSKVQEGK